MTIRGTKSKQMDIQKLIEKYEKEIKERKADTFCSYDCTDCGTGILEDVVNDLKAYQKSHYIEGDAGTVVIPEILWPAQRQYRRNDSNEFVSGFDLRKTIKIVQSLTVEGEKKPLNSEDSIQIREGIIKQGGVSSQPTQPKPNVTPVAQKPQPPS